MSDLDSYRVEIDCVDEQLLELLERRMEIVMKISSYKKRNDIPVLNQARENEVIRKNIARLKNKAYAGLAEEFFTEVMRLSRKLQMNN